MSPQTVWLEPAPLSLKLTASIVSFTHAQWPPRHFPLQGRPTVKVLSVALVPTKNSCTVSHTFWELHNSPRALLREEWDVVAASPVRQMWQPALASMLLLYSRSPASTAPLRLQLLRGPLAQLGGSDWVDSVWRVRSAVPDAGGRWRAVITQSPAWSTPITHQVGFPHARYRCVEPKDCFLLKHNHFHWLL